MINDDRYRRVAPSAGADVQPHISSAHHRPCAVPRRDRLKIFKFKFGWVFHPATKNKMIKRLII
jgi:hypothetical protein